MPGTRTQTTTTTPQPWVEQIPPHAKAANATVFRVASITKPILSLVAMRLATDGVLALGRPVHVLLRNYSEPDTNIGASVIELACQLSGASPAGATAS